MSSFTAESPLQKPTHFSPNFANSIPRPERSFLMSPIVLLLIGAAKALAAELASRSITVNVIAPGLIDTAMASAEDRERILPYIPMRRLGSPDEVAAVAAFLLSDDAAYVTRAVIPVSGGLIG